MSENLTFIGTGNFTGTGNSRNNTITGGTGNDTLSGGAGNDVFKFSATTLTAADKVVGGTGTDKLAMTSAGVVTVSGVSGVETYALASGGANTLNLANANFAGVTGAKITVVGGSAGNTLSEAGVSAGDAAVLNGGAGADTLIAGRNATMTGGAGADLFELTTPGTVATPDTNQITDFQHALDELCFRDVGFNLGVDEGTGTAIPQAISPSLFSSHTDSTFATTADRFAYDKTIGVLFYDADGSGAAHGSQALATLSTQPTLTAADLFIVA